MVFAHGAGKLFDIHKAAEFEETILAKCLDTYIALSVMHNPPTPVSKASQAPPQLSIVLWECSRRCQHFSQSGLSDNALLTVRVTLQVTSL